MKTSFQFILIIGLIAASFASCDVVDIAERNSIRIKFSNITSQDFEGFTIDGESLGRLNSGEESEYIEVDFGDNTFKDLILSASIGDEFYSKNLSIMMTLPGYLYCGVGLEDKLMLEKGGEFTIDVYIDKMSPNTLKTELNW